MASAWFVASTGTVEEFLAVYEPSMATRSDESPLLFRAVAHPDPHARVTIATRLLDDGADAAFITSDRNDSGTVLHALWSAARERDLASESVLLARLLDQGADINHRSPRFGPPLAMMIVAMMTLEDIHGFWDVIVAHSRPDLSLIAENGMTLARRLDVRPLEGLLQAYLEESGQTDLLEENA